MSLILSGSDGLSDVDGSAATPAIRGTDANTGIFFPAADTIAFAEGGAEAARIDSAGNFGLGVTPPTSTDAGNITIKGGSTLNFSTASGNIASNATFNSGWKYIATAAAVKYTQSGAEHQWFNAASGTAGNAISFTQAMTLDASGNLLVGGTAQTNGGKTISFFNGGTQNGFVANDTSSSSFTTFFQCSNNGTSIGTISRVGATSAVVYNTTSDQRLKSNIEDASPVLNKLMDVKVRQFDWTEGDLHQDYGFIAQEIETTLSGVVTKGKTEDDVWQLDYARLTPHLVKAIQEQQALILSLTDRITALETP